MASKVLFIGYGNPGRLDDGLGPACADAVARLGLPDVTVDADYQLSVEDAATAAEHDVVVFADASVNGAEPFGFHPVSPVEMMSFSTHSVEPEAVMGMVRTLFKAPTRGFALAIRGYEFNEFEERLSAKARTNLEAAVRFVERLIIEDRFEEYDDNEGDNGEAGVVIRMTTADLN